MDDLIPFFGRLLWWQRPLVVALPVLLAALVLPMLYNGVLKPSIDILRGKCPKEDRKAGWEHLAYGSGLLAIATGLTWLFYNIQIEWLGGHQHLVTLGAFLVGAYEVLHGLGVLLFRTGMLGVLGGIYTFGGFCLYCLLHWTLGWF